MRIALRMAMPSVGSVLIITDVPRTAQYAGLALSLLGVRHDVAGSLAEALGKLQEGRYGSALIDLRWEDRTALTLASWAQAHLTSRGIRLIVAGNTPLARNLDVTVRLGSAVLLGRTFDLADLREAVVPAAATRRAAEAMA